MKLCATTPALVGLLCLCACSPSARGGPLAALAEYSDPTPGDTGGFRTFGKLQGFSPHICGTNIVFGATTDESAGYYAYIDGKLRKVMDTKTKMPGREFNFGVALSGGSSATISGRNVAFPAATGEGSSIWLWLDGEYRLIADTHTAVPGGVGNFIGFGTLNGIAPSVSGENVAFTAFSELGGGIYAHIDGKLVVVADTSTWLPGANQTVTSFGITYGLSPTISGRKVVFTAIWGFVGSGIYTWEDGKYEVVAATGTPRPEGGTFGGFPQTSGISPAIDGDNVVFRTGPAVYARINGSLRLIAGQDTTAPGFPGDFKPFTGHRPSISGENIVFAAFVDSLGVAIVAFIDGQFRLIASPETQVPGRDYNFAANSFWSSAGTSPSISGENVVFMGSPPGGIYTYLPPTQADFDDNDCVDLADFGALQRCQAMTPEDPEFNQCLSALDLDGNKTINLIDHAAFVPLQRGP